MDKEIFKQITDKTSTDMQLCYEYYAHESRGKGRHPIHFLQFNQLFSLWVNNITTLVSHLKQRHG